MNRDSRKEKEREERRNKEKQKGERRERERTQRWLSQRQNISLVPYDGAGSSGVWVGVDLIFINISRVAHAQRAASLPTNLRGPHVETDRGSEKRNEWKKEGERR